MIEFEKIIKTIEDDMKDIICEYEREEALRLFKDVKQITDMSDLYIRAESFNHAKDILSKTFNTLRKKMKE